jgi:membrane protein required for colicin V production
MENLSFTTFDFIVAAVIMLSAIMAFSSGFVRSILFVLSWAGAAFITRELYEPARAYGRQLIPEQIIADIATAVVLFVVILVVLSVFTDAVSKAVSGSGFRGVDRLLGLGFGVVVGCAIVSLGYLAYRYVVPPADQPAWMTNARTFPAVKQGADMLDRYVPDEFRKKGSGTGTLTPTDRNLAPPTGSPPVTPAPPPPASPTAPANPTGGQRP